MITEIPTRISKEVVGELEDSKKYHIIIGVPGTPTALTICGLSGAQVRESYSHDKGNFPVYIGKAVRR